MIQQQRDVDNSERVHVFLKYLFDDTELEVAVCTPNVGWLTRLPSLAPPPNETEKKKNKNKILTVIPRHELVRNYAGLETLMLHGKYWVPGSSVVVWQYNGVVFYASCCPQTGHVFKNEDGPVGRMHNSTSRLFKRLDMADQINARKRQFTDISEEHKAIDFNDDDI
jgi:hypothetical protein